MRIDLVTPVRYGSRSGNGVTARRYARLLRELGHRVRTLSEWGDGRADALVALHARKSHDSIERFHALRPRAPIVVVLTGTDLYLDLPRSARTRRSLDLADRLVVLQPLALRALPARHRRKATVIAQSVPRLAAAPRARSFEVCVVGHLRPVKDPLRPALAVRSLPPEARLRVTHIGGSLSPALARRARVEERRNPRYRWLGERPRAETLRRLAASQALVLPSLAEGGANVVSEAIAAGIPVLASRIPGSVGLLGPRHPGYFPAGDTRALRALLRRLEHDERFRARLAARSRALRPIVRPARERAAWRKLLAGL